MQQNWEVAGLELRNGDQRLVVQVDPTLGEAIRVGSFDAVQRFLGSQPEPTPSNGNGNGTKHVAAPAPRASRGPARGVGRTNEWTFNATQRAQLAKAVRGKKLPQLERQVLEARFLSKDAVPTAAQLAEKLGLKHNSEVTLLTKRGLKHAGLRVPRLRKRNKR